MIDHALTLYDNGYSIIPVNKHKKPLTRWAQYQHTRPTREQIIKWWTKYPNANPAIITGQISGIIVIDIDAVEGESAATSMGLPETLTVCTARGKHLYYSYPGIPVKTRAHVLPSVDVRGDGGYVVAPGAVHEDGTVYSVVCDMPIGEMPGWVVV